MMLGPGLRALTRMVRAHGASNPAARLAAHLRLKREVRRWRAEAHEAPALRRWVGPATIRPPIFVGGTGRSGTTITGQLLGAHPAYALVRHEVHFITDPGGLCDLAEGLVTVDRFERAFVKRWFVRSTGTGIHRFAERTLIARALRELRETFALDGDLAIRRFVHRLFDPIAEREDADGWVEMTPNNALVADVLLRVFPDAKLVHTVRDGRDAAASVVQLGWGPSDLHAAIQWWGTRLHRAFEATEGLPADRLLVIQMEDLTVRDRQAEFAKLLRWAELSEHADIRRFFDEQLTERKANGGRWRRDVPADQLGAFMAAYDSIVAGFRRRGWPYGPEEERGPTPIGAPQGLHGVATRSGSASP